MAESRRENEGSCDFPFFALAALPMLPVLRSPVPRLGGDTGPWLQGNAGPLVWGAFILTASKSKINDETPLNSCSL